MTLPTPPRLHQESSRARFSSLAWGMTGVDNGTHSSGLIAGGMSSGVVRLWDAERLIQQETEDVELSEVNTFESAVTSVQFNPHDKHLLAAGDS